MKDAESNKFLHKFISDNNNCDICNHSLQEHHEYVDDAAINKTVNIINNKVNNFEDVFDDPDLCQICFETKLNSNNKVMLMCKHEFCYNCINGYLRNKINNGVVN